MSKRSEWPQLSDEDYERLVDLEPDEMDREIGRILAERAPDRLPDLDCGGDDEC